MADSKDYKSPKLNPDHKGLLLKETGFAGKGNIPVSDLKKITSAKNPDGTYKKVKLSNGTELQVNADVVKRAVFVLNFGH